MGNATADEESGMVCFFAPSDENIQLNAFVLELGLGPDQDNGTKFQVI
mgnify:CR=1 FL=1